MEGYAGFGEGALEDLADFGAHDTLKWRTFHTDDADAVLFGQGVGDLHADEGAAGDDDLFALLLTHGREDGLDVWDGAEEENVFEVFETWKGERFRGAACGEDEFGVRVGFSGFG